MKTLETIYRYGQFYNRKTGERIIPAEGAEAIITFVETDHLLVTDPIYDLSTPKSSADKLKEVTKYTKE